MHGRDPREERRALTRYRQSIKHSDPPAVKKHCGVCKELATCVGCPDWRGNEAELGCPQYNPDKRLEAIMLRRERCPHCGASSNIMVEIDDVFRVRRKNAGIVRETPEKRLVRAYPSFDGHCHFCGE